MRERVMGRLGWRVGEVGYGMWGIAGGSGGFLDADLASAPDCLDLAVELGCTFFDTAASYGRGVSEPSSYGTRATTAIPSAWQRGNSSSSGAWSKTL